MTLCLQDETKTLTVPPPSLYSYLSCAAGGARRHGATVVKYSQAPIRRTYPRPVRRTRLWSGCLALLLASCGEQAPQLQVGDPAPAFTTRRLDGSGLAFPDDYRGQVVALRFWADWCRFCRDEMKAIEPVYMRLRGSGLAVLAVNVGQSEAVAERFVRNLSISYETALDPETVVAHRYGVVGLPLTYFVDRQGRVREKVLGEADAAVFERMAGELLRETVP